MTIRGKRLPTIWPARGAAATTFHRINSPVQFRDPDRCPAVPADRPVPQQIRLRGSDVALILFRCHRDSRCAPIPVPSWILAALFFSEGHVSQRRALFSGSWNGLIPEHGADFRRHGAGVNMQWEGYAGLFNAGVRGLSWRWRAMLKGASTAPVRGHKPRRAAGDRGLAGRSGHAGAGCAGLAAAWRALRLPCRSPCCAGRGLWCFTASLSIPSSRFGANNSAAARIIGGLGWVDPLSWPVGALFAAACVGKVALGLRSGLSGHRRASGIGEIIVAAARNEGMAGARS